MRAMAVALLAKAKLMTSAGTADNGVPLIGIDSVVELPLNGEVS